MALNYTMYRTTTLGDALERTLEDFINDGSITPHLAKRMLLNFDKAINQKLNTQINNKMQFKAEKLQAYRFCDNVWTFLMKDVDIRDPTAHYTVTVQRLKVVACGATSRG
uniref:Transcription initiation factor IIA subunit 2 n=1 Tax=Panagrolaimus sp. PS1159 TaxID=55785 RepID=A0AC35G9S4_9BILA